MANQKLEGWLLSAGALDLPLGAVEREIERRGQEVLRLMLQPHVQARGTGDVGAKIELSGGDGAELGRGRTHKRGIETIVGEISVERTSYGAQGRESLHPLDGQAALPDRRYSYELQRRIVLGAVKGPFHEACAGVAEATGVTVPKRSAETLVREAARDFDAFYATRNAPSADETGPILVAAIDCKGIPMVEPEKALRVVRRGKGEKANKKRMASQVVKGMGKSATSRGLTGQKREVVDGVRRYFYRNRHRMRYHEYLRDGLPIASGAVEGACRNLIKDRMERSGMRWTIDTAEALVKLRATYLSADFEEYWRFHVDTEHRRLHAEGHWRVVEK